MWILYRNRQACHLLDPKWTLRWCNFLLERMVFSFQDLDFCHKRSVHYNYCIIFHQRLNRWLFEWLDLREVSEDVVAGVTDLLLLSLMLLSSDNSLSSLLVFALLVFGCSLFFGEANLLTCGSVFSHHLESASSKHGNKTWDRSHIAGIRRHSAKQFFSQNPLGNGWKKHLST